MSFNSVTMSQLGVQGERTKGADVRQQNIMAAMSIANIVKSSLGPVGLDKMMVDDVSAMKTLNFTILDSGSWGCCHFTSLTLFYAVAVTFFRAEFYDT